MLGRTGALSLKVGTLLGDNLPQMLFRVGGPETVRGYQYGSRQGRHFWSAQLDFATSRSPFFAPVLFVDAGDTFSSSSPLIGAGAGVSLISGMIRLNVAKGLNPSGDLRFDLLFRAPR